MIINWRRIILFLKNYSQVFVFLLFLGIPFLYYLSLNFKNQLKCNFSSPVLVTKVIDGDTIIVEGGKILRILGIDADEKDYPCYEEAKKRLEELVLNKKVTIKKGKDSIDKYGRCLGYIFLENENVGFVLVREGLVVCRGNEENLKYQEECENLEKNAREKLIGCKWTRPVFSNEKIIPACKAKNYYGENIIVEGRIAESYLSKNNNLFLNFEKKYPYQCFTGVIFSSNLKYFPENFREIIFGKKVRIRGVIKEYKGKPEIIITQPQQIEILE